MGLGKLSVGADMVLYLHVSKPWLQAIGGSLGCYTPMGSISHLRGSVSLCEVSHLRGSVSPCEVSYPRGSVSLRSIESERQCKSAKYRIREAA
jgi:hypothetical protein